MIEVKVRLFGVFKKIGNGSELRVNLPGALTIREFRERFCEQVRGEGFDPGAVFESAFASEDRILGLDDRLERSCTIAVLPPVCGG